MTHAHRPRFVVGFDADSATWPDEIGHVPLSLSNEDAEKEAAISLSPTSCRPALNNWDMDPRQLGHTFFAVGGALRHQFLLAVLSSGPAGDRRELEASKIPASEFSSPSACRLGIVHAS